MFSDLHLLSPKIKLSHSHIWLPDIKCEPEIKVLSVEVVYFLYLYIIWVVSASYGREFDDPVCYMFYFFYLIKKQELGNINSDIDISWQ